MAQLSIPDQGSYLTLCTIESSEIIIITAVFPLEVEQRFRGDSTRALVHGLSALNEDLFKGHAGLSEALAAEVKTRPDAKKALAREVSARRRPGPGCAGGCAGPAPSHRRGITGTPTHCSGRRALGPVRPGLDWQPASG